MHCALMVFLAFLVTAQVSMFGQSGDKAGEVQADRVPKERIPSAPRLTAEEALKTFKVPEGFEVQIVASEPLVDTPVAMSFDPDGRLYVVEMRGYMRNYEGTGETNALGRIVRLEDKDGDGRMDTRTVFLDQLVMPRAIALVRDGLLVAEPPHLWFVRDTNGDGAGDDRELIAKDFAVENDPKRGMRSNPEHASNGLYWALDNWIYSANHTTRFRLSGEGFIREPTINRGQWGMTQDDYGRLFFNSNSDHLRGDLVPSHYANRSSIVPTIPGLNAQIVKDQTVWPGRVNPGVNRGYQPAQLRPDGTLATFTGACGPVIYRGDQFPDSYRGDAFVCEPTGNLIRRSKMVDKDGWLSGANAEDKSEFLTSTDERFRPVNLYNGPDGALYVVDMARGLIQHRIYLTSYLRKQLEGRELLGPLDQGRIYRIVHKNRPKSARPESMSKLPDTGLVGALLSNNGWRRDTAQRLLIERGGEEVVTKLGDGVKNWTNDLSRLHALWTLDGMDRIRPEDVMVALRDKNPKIRRAGLRLSERFVRQGNIPEMIRMVLTVGRDRETEVRWQAALTMTFVEGPEALASLVDIGGDDTLPDYVQKAALASLAGREVSGIRTTIGKVGHDSLPVSGKLRVLRSLAQAIILDRKEHSIRELFEVIGQSGIGVEMQRALLDGCGDLVVAARRSNRRVKPIRMEKEPTIFAKLRETSDQERLDRLDALVIWPGKPGADQEKGPPPLTAAETKLFESGRELYVLSCAVCHQPHGRGQDGLAPPLLDSEWVLGGEQRLINIVLHGVRGPIKVGERNFDMDMPGLGALDDMSIASILTYLRREWGHESRPVQVETVARVRAANDKRDDAWTSAELMKLPEADGLERSKRP